MRCCSRNLLTTLIFEYLGACVMALFCPEMLNFLRGPTFVCSLATLILKRATSCLISLQEKGLFLKIFTFFDSMFPFRVSPTHPQPFLLDPFASQDSFSCPEQTVLWTFTHPTTNPTSSHVPPLRRNSTRASVPPIRT